MIKEIKVGKSEKGKENIELWCPWCEHKDIYAIAKYDQPRCKKCNKFVPKRRYINSN